MGPQGRGGQVPHNRVEPLSPRSPLSRLGKRRCWRTPKLMEQESTENLVERSVPPWRHHSCSNLQPHATSFLSPKAKTRCDCLHPSICRCMPACSSLLPLRSSRLLQPPSTEKRYHRPPFTSQDRFHLRPGDFIWITRHCLPKGATSTSRNQSLLHRY